MRDNIYQTYKMRKKTIRIFLGEKNDVKRIFETIRMALGITLKGNSVELYISKDVKLDGIEKEKKEEIDEFLQALEYMGGKYEFVENINQLINHKTLEKEINDILVL